MSGFKIDPNLHHYMGIEMNQQTWRLLGKEDRNNDDNRRMIQFAMASLYHWRNSTKFQPVNAQRGHWLISRVYAVLEQSEQAVVHATHCMNLTLKLELEDFDLAYAHEAMSRAHAAAGHLQEANESHRRAKQAGDSIAKDKDKTLFFEDLTGGPWFDMAL